MCLTDGYGGYERMRDAPDDVRDGALLDADMSEHCLCEFCAYAGFTTRVCLANALEPEERLCGGETQLALAVDGLPSCASCAVASVVFAWLEVIGLHAPPCDLCAGTDGTHKHGCPG